MKTLIKKSLTVMLLLFSGCSSYQYYAIQSNNITFSKYRTFAWLPTIDTAKNDGYTDVADGHIKDAVTAKLENIGLILNSARPDLLVRYQKMVKNKTKVYDEPQYIYIYNGFYPGDIRYRHGRYYYYNYASPFPVYMGSEIVRVPYQEGTLVIDLIDRREKRVIWRGYGIGEITDPETSIKDIPEVVNGILDKLPIKPITK